MKVRSCNSRLPYTQTPGSFKLSPELSYVVVIDVYLTTSGLKFIQDIMRFGNIMDHKRTAIARRP